MRETSENHGRLMDGIYRNQRRIYDATRKYYLLGRDHLISQMDPAPDARILEVACGTGRNLDLIDRRYPGRKLFGLDISEEMLMSARKKLGSRAVLVQGDACDFDSVALFDSAGFDHIVLSYSLSMIPDWQAAVAESIRHLAPGGTIHIIDFGDQSNMPSWFRAMLLNWLDKFHVSPRNDLGATLSGFSKARSITVQHKPLFRTYAQYARIEAA